MVFFMSAILTVFLFVVSSIQKYMLKTHASIVNFFSFPFSLLDFCLIYFEIVLLSTYEYRIVVYKTY